MLLSIAVALREPNLTGLKHVSDTTHQKKKIPLSAPASQPDFFCIDCDNSNIQLAL